MVRAGRRTEHEELERDQTAVKEEIVEFSPPAFNDDVKEETCQEILAAASLAIPDAGLKGGRFHEDD